MCSKSTKRRLQALCCGCVLARQATVVQAFARAPVRMLSTPRSVSHDSAATETESHNASYSPAGWYFPQQDNSKSLLARPPFNPANKGGVYVPQYELPDEQENGPTPRREAVDNFEEHDEVWLTMRREAREAADKESLLVSYIHSTILHQRSLEESMAFALANKLAGPSMTGTQLQALFLEYARASPNCRRSVRRDIIAVRDRDPACTSYHDALLYFKGFQALQTHRVAHWLYTQGRQPLSRYLQSQVNQHFQIDIHPAASIGEGVFIDHGTGVVIGETSVIGDDCSILHQVTLGGSGLDTGNRHPKVGSGVLIGAGAVLLGDITVGDGAQIGACSMVLSDIPAGCVAVGVPAKVLGKSKVKNPAAAMQQDFYVQVWGGMDI